MPEKPTTIDLYAYNVYFGDCFLLVFNYPSAPKRSVLIDFGSTGKGSSHHGREVAESDEASNESTGARLLKVAKHVAETCGNSLDVVVATHRHKDHIYGFGLKEAGKVILDCRPKIVIQPWTEDPQDQRDLSRRGVTADGETFRSSPEGSFAAMLNDMHLVAESIETEAKTLGEQTDSVRGIDTALRDRIIFTADDNKIKNKAAVQNLHAMGTAPDSQSHYVYFGYDKIDWETILPGVNVKILGPPRLEDSSEITSATSSSEEFWSLQAIHQHFWSVQAATSRVIGSNARTNTIFPASKAIHERPPNVRWIIRQLRAVRASQLLEIVRFVDSALNNTSVIMLFQVGGQSMLFPGDAQIENWRYALNKPEIRDLLKTTTLYKVGHHGSRNATPRSLWNGFERKSRDPEDVNRLTTLVSTMEGKHGETPETAVPLPKMVTEMKLLSSYNSTEEVKGELFVHLNLTVS